MDCSQQLVSPYKTCRLFAGHQTYAMPVAASGRPVKSNITQAHAMKSSPIANRSPVASFTSHLTNEQLQALSRCASGISLRFDALEIVNALIAGGYAQKGVAGVITVTAEGHKYLRSHS
jgi:hypothetical protein